MLMTDASLAYVQVFDKTSGTFITWFGITRFGDQGDEGENLENSEGISIDGGLGNLKFVKSAFQRC